MFDLFKEGHSELQPDGWQVCNPATQAHDLALMDELYKVTRIQPVDMFPHTHHVENVALLERRVGIKKPTI